jgi:hypothetical protein
MAADEVPLRVGYDVPKPAKPTATPEVQQQLEVVAAQRAREVDAALRRDGVLRLANKVRSELSYELSYGRMHPQAVDMLRALGRIAAMCNGDAEVLAAVLASLA